MSIYSKSSNTISVSIFVLQERQLKREAAESRHRQRMDELEEELRSQGNALKAYLTERDSLVEQRCLTRKKHREAVIKHAR